MNKAGTKLIRKQTAVWVTADKRKIRICDMGNDHLLNTINMLQRAHAVRKLRMPAPRFQGELAQLFAEQEYADFQNSGPEESFPIYDKLVLEAERRGLACTQ